MSAMKAELKQLLDKNVFDPVHKITIPFTNGKQNIITNQSLIKVKRNNFFLFEAFQRVMSALFFLFVMNF